MCGVWADSAMQAGFVRLLWGNYQRDGTLKSMKTKGKKIHNRKIDINTYEEQPTMLLV